jgi:cytochrome c-type biogenesis protein CcmH/NrfG
MPPNSEIEKLERRWKDNPMGTGFAPYAEALRKQGEVDLAREVLRQGLENHPDHIPGNIVLGRCCLDLVEDGPAETAFRHVLDLDVENVIALKALAEITERQGRLGEAVDWLTRLVASDPNNDEAVAHLARVEASRAAAAAAGSR